MITWGDGGRYNPALNTWTAVTTNGAPAPRAYHPAVWTRTEMIVWGGLSNATYFADGARYNPATDSWTATTNTGAPAARAEFTVVCQHTQRARGSLGGVDGQCSAQTV